MHAYYNIGQAGLGLDLGLGLRSGFGFGFGLVFGLVLGFGLALGLGLGLALGLGLGLGIKLLFESIVAHRVKFALPLLVGDLNPSWLLDLRNVRGNELFAVQNTDLFLIYTIMQAKRTSC